MYIYIYILWAFRGIFKQQNNSLLNHETEIKLNLNCIYNSSNNRNNIKHLTACPSLNK